MAQKSRIGNSRGPAGTSIGAFRVEVTGDDLTTNQGVPIADNENSLHAGERAPTLLEDFIPREKIRPLRPRAHPRPRRSEREGTRRSGRRDALHRQAFKHATAVAAGGEARTFLPRRGCLSMEIRLS
jgi:hypothetical protein